MKWLNRTGITMPYYGLCLSKADYLRVCKRTQQEHPNPFLDEDAHATTHSITDDNGVLYCVVALGEDHSKLTAPELNALLVHEAVHIFQEWCIRHGEKQPSSEFMAYCIQSLSQNLMQEYERLFTTKEKPCPVKEVDNVELRQ